MAHAALLSLEQTIYDIVNHDEYSFSPHQKQQLISISENIVSQRVFLEEFPEKANTLEDRMVDLANEVKSIILRFKQFTRLDKFAARQIRSRLGEMLDAFKEMVIGAAVGNSPAVGDDLLAVKERLCGGSPRLQVIPIVGMGGIGKTTLARDAYHDPLIVEHFQIRAWVTVSQDYCAEEIFSRLLLFVKMSELEIYEQSSDELNVYKSLKFRRYLIVLDDMWSTKAWDDVKMVFPDDGNGSRVVLTTRLLDVAAYADSSSHLHRMHLMDNDQSWDLLRRKVFTHEERCTVELENMGKEIARSCVGLPLAIVVIGGLLSTVSKTRVSWEEIMKNVDSAFKFTKDGQFEKLLSLSYTHLPRHLRPCFLYMGAFPEDHEINVSKLIKLWIAEGFINSSGSGRSFEEEAEEYLEDLVKRSVVLVSNRKSDGKIKSCRLHDIIRELCIEKAQEEKFLRRVMDREVPKESIKNQLRLCISQSNLNCLANIYGSTTPTIMCFSKTASSLHYLEYFKFLKILDLVYAHFNFFFSEEIVWLPSQVFELFHLVFLAFGYPITHEGWHVTIPESVLNLENLRTLIIYPRMTKWNPPCTVSLPWRIWGMPQLRHLVCFNFVELPSPEDQPKISAMANLQTLSSVKDLVCTEKFMKMIPNVKKLGIFYEDNRDYHLENLVHLQQLEKLKLSYTSEAFRWEMPTPSFPMTLKKLSLCGLDLPWEDMMRNIGSLPNLQVLKLMYPRFSDGDTWQTVEGEFTQLKYLLINYSRLQYWITESSHFPRLKCLMLQNCWFLNDIPDGIGEIPTLELIELKGDYNTYLKESVKSIQEEQQSYGNDAFEARCL